MYNFYGDYDLTNFFEKALPTPDPNARIKNLCLCISSKKTQPPVHDVILVIGKQIDVNTGQIYHESVNSSSDSIQINWDVPDGYKKLSYSVGINGCLNRLLCLKSRDIMKRKIRAKIIDRYPPVSQDRKYYPFPQ